MDLKQFIGEWVRVVDMDGDVFVGEVSDYIWADDQPDEIGEIDAIVLDIPRAKYPMEFLRTDIKSVEVIEKISRKSKGE